jgi:hypothetical protein
VQGGLQQLGRAANSEQRSGFGWFVGQNRVSVMRRQKRIKGWAQLSEMGSKARRPRSGETRDCWRGVICAKSALREFAIGADVVCEEIITLCYWKFSHWWLLEVIGGLYLYLYCDYRDGRADRLEKSARILMKERSLHLLATSHLVRDSYS